MITYQLIPGGYALFLDGEAFRVQYFDPTLSPKQPYTEAEATSVAEALVAEITAAATA